MLSMHDDDGQTPDQLASRLGVLPPVITKTVNRLQAQGFLGGPASDIDARQTQISLTVSGNDSVRAVKKSIKKTEEKAFKGFDKRDVKKLSKLLLRIEANLSDLTLIED